VPDLAAVRTAIVANVAAVTDIGTVHDYERYAKNQTEMRGFYEATISGVKQIRGWHLVRLSDRTINPALGRDDVRAEWELRGFMSLDDAAATEKTFDALVNAVRAALRADPDLGNVANTHDADSEQAGWQVPEINKVMFTGVLCHHARLRLITWHYE